MRRRMKEAELRISTMALVGCWALLLLTTIPVLAVAGRQEPYRFAQISATAQANKMIHNVAHQLQENAIRAPTFTIWKEKKQQQPSTRPGEPAYVHSRLLVGSSPPTCRGSCGLCQPCTPVHVVIGIPHVAMTEQEYYPEVWRCQCGNILYMP